MLDTAPPRNVIYFSSGANQIPLSRIGSLPYTDVIVSFLVPDEDLMLHGAGGAFNSELQSSIETLQDAGLNVLISFGGGKGVSTSSYESYAQDVDGLVGQLVTFVTSHGFSGVDIDYEDDAGFTGTYDGVGFLIALTNGLAQSLPAGQNIITHAPQTPYWDPDYHNAPYTQIWQGAGTQITWINNQFYNNPSWDATPELKVAWYNQIAAITGPQKLMAGGLVGPSAADEGFLSLEEMISQVITPLQDTWGPEFGGVMGWEFARDTDGTWADEIWQALAGPAPLTTPEKL